MNLCSNNHDEVCHEGRTCPVCELFYNFQELSNEFNNLEEELNRVQRNYDDLVEAAEEHNPELLI